MTDTPKPYDISYFNMLYSVKPSMLFDSWKELTPEERAKRAEEIKEKERIRNERIARIEEAILTVVDADDWYWYKDYLEDTWY